MLVVRCSCFGSIANVRRVFDALPACCGKETENEEGYPCNSFSTTILSRDNPKHSPIK